MVIDFFKLSFILQVDVIFGNYFVVVVEVVVINVVIIAVILIEVMIDFVFVAFSTVIDIGS